MLDVVAAWCGPCKIMDKTTFSDPAVVDWSKKNRHPRARRRGEGRGAAHRGALSGLFVSHGALPRRERKRDRPRRGRLPPERFPPHRRRRPHRQDAASREPGQAQGVVERRRGDGGCGRARGAARPPAAQRPIALRIVSEEGDLGRPEVLQLFLQLVALEAMQNDQSSETADLVATFLPRLGTDPRRGFFAAALVTGLGKRGDVASARAVTQETLQAARRVHADVRRRPRGARRRRAPGRQRPRGARRISARRLDRREERRRRRDARRAPARPRGGTRRRRKDGRGEEGLSRGDRDRASRHGALRASGPRRARLEGLRRGRQARAPRRRALERRGRERRRPRSRRRSARRATAPAPRRR